MLDFSLPRVMGILNITPDSFSDGGQLFDAKDTKARVDRALTKALRMQAEGADILDVGGESTRPGAQPVSAQEELDRVIPVIEALRRECTATISVDTRKADVMRAAVAAGARCINDVNALRDPDALLAAATAARQHPELVVCLMHMQGEPRTMQQSPVYGDVVSDVISFLQQRIAACQAAGIHREQLVVDPGFGFGKTLSHNLDLLRHLDRFSSLGCPVLAGLSRKSMIGTLTGRKDPADRLAGSLALAWVCLERNVKILRVHDVRETVDLVRIHQAVKVPFDSAQGT